MNTDAADVQDGVAATLRSLAAFWRRRNRGGNATAAAGDRGVRAAHDPRRAPPAAV
eukprot:CAMPEP_0174873664 /NCGR_PEP_ID=MMETSP1114-20130205/75294_1 /TAXON_ID=312471 /ORGANISM="Neobodo designis, Strain CCAP 1951/1" /LENGTH=55 /DNA_ID=CAMNT_0016108987 /DNA_START=1 /DNA_END=164 /DNA_ORIENTATION=+